MAEPALANRRFGVRGVPTRIGWMLVVGFFLVEALLFGVAVSGPPNTTKVRLSALAHTIGVSDAWSFLGVFAAFVVAIQVTAWGNQQAGDRIARTRSSRFTGAAVLTGSVTVACWFLFTIAFNTEATGQYLLLTAAAVGVVFFAADGASIVLRSDRRAVLRADVRQTIGDTCGVLYAEFARLRYPVIRFAGCLAAFMVWCLVLSAGTLTLIAVAARFSGQKVNPNDWFGAFFAFTVALSFLLAASIGSVLCALIWRSRRRRSSSASGFVARNWGYAAGAVACAFVVDVTWAVFTSSAAVVGLVWWEILGVLVILAGPALIPFTALIGMGRPTPKRNWWTPRGSVRIAIAAASRTYVHSQMRDVSDLTALFDHSDGELAG